MEYFFLSNFYSILSCRSFTGRRIPADKVFHSFIHRNCEQLFAVISSRWTVNKYVEASYALGLGCMRIFESVIAATNHLVIADSGISCAGGGVLSRMMQGEACF
jgi:hypothetical protein